MGGGATSLKDVDVVFPVSPSKEVVIFCSKLGEGTKERKSMKRVSSRSYGLHKGSSSTSFPQLVGKLNKLANTAKR